MKARIISTGEIINIADYARVTLDKCDGYGNPIEVQFEDVELIKDASNTNDWQQVRIQAAIAAMKGILSNETRHTDAIDSCGDEYTIWASIAVESVDYANALVEELKRRQL